MILTWIAIGLAGAALTATIITYWNDIVDWAKRLLDGGHKKVLVAIKWINDKLTPKIYSLFGGKPVTSTPPSRLMTKEELEEFIITLGLSDDEANKLRNGKNVSTSLNLL